MLAEAALLREHRNRLENRMVILEEHNRQLETQLDKLKCILEPGGSPTNKTGTLNTKSVTASQLAQDSPILPHRLNGAGPAKVPPAVPPRTARPAQQSGSVKLGQLSREGQQALEEVFRASTLSRRGDGRVPFRRETSVPRSSANWSDSLPRKDLFSTGTNSLPRRDKAGLGRPEPGRAPAPPSEPQQKLSGNAETKRENPFRDAFLGTDKRSSTGNLFFTDQFDNHPWENPELGRTAVAATLGRRRVSGNTSQEGEQARAVQGEQQQIINPAATLQAMAGNVGKELNQLISLMNNEDTENNKAEHN